MSGCTISVCNIRQWKIVYFLYHFKYCQNKFGMWDRIRDILIEKVYTC